MAQHLVDCLERIARPRIAVVGDLMLDEYVWGAVDRISPEAPIPVLRVDRRHDQPGGAGSVVVDLARLGAEVTVYGVVGDDAAGRRILEIFASEGADTSGIVVDADRPTTRKSRHMGFVQQAHRAVQQMLRVDEEDARPLSREIVDALIGRFRNRSGGCEAILLSDYGKGLLQPDACAAIIEGAGNVPVLADPARIDDYSRYAGAALICPNRFEAELATGIGCREIPGAARAGAELIARHRLGAVAVTLDRDGILLCEPGGRSQHVPTRVRVVADVTGAGDMVLSVLGLVTAAGGDLIDAVRLANVAGGLEVRRLGATPVSREEILQELRFEGHPAAAKYRSAEELAPVLAAERASGRTVVFTNGCFDLLHFGHHRLLHDAAEEGDILVVAINSDASVRRLKGPSRPKTPQDDRVRMLAALEVVDHILIFDDDTPNRLLELLRPDVLVKGSEYRERPEGVVGREIVEAYGGRIAYAQQVPGISTTALLEGSGGSA